MKFKSFLSVAAILGLALVTGCARYQAKQLKPQATTVTMFKDKAISLYCHTFTQHEGRKYLGRDITKQGYTAIQVTIANSTERYLKVSPSNISLRTVPSEVVAKKVAFSPAKRFVGWGIAGLFFPVLFIPAIVDPAWAYEANEELSADYAAKAIQDKIIPPHAEVSGMIFVANEDYKRSFSIALTDEKSHETIICQAIC